ncbi:unnamed protein product [Absidia cylindrospora]
MAPSETRRIFYTAPPTGTLPPTTFTKAMAANKAAKAAKATKAATSVKVTPENGIPDVIIKVYPGVGNATYTFPKKNNTRICDWCECRMDNSHTNVNCVLKLVQDGLLPVICERCGLPNDSNVDHSNCLATEEKSEVCQLCWNPDHSDNLGDCPFI